LAKVSILFDIQWSEKKLIKSTINLPSKDLEDFEVFDQPNMLICVPFGIGQELSQYPINNSH